MLEIKNVEKTYRPKKGVPVKALDGVSLSFADTGLVFILGKSGSGKSTLLNVIGGLDKADSGEFVIKGKSSEHFKQGDFDAYRNTFIGFIFQEYNILNEFNVGQNIALAMELQGKKATGEALSQILDQVDLPGYATRKPNELSGGQKQRVAIARALIKEPEIIMADEPTGALDSNTGKQVFDTLKKLSQTKLVIVVSHDRDFAEYYGDRVIELADGKVISDISKYSAQGVKKSESVHIIDNSIVQIKRGSALTDADFEIIRNYIKTHDGDILISSDARANTSFKQMAMITDDGGKASFKDTVDAEIPKKQYTPEQSQFIHSRLPFKNALKIGASSLKTKPIRLFFTIFLSFIAFALFGLSDTLASYNKYSAAVNSIVTGEITYASFNTLEPQTSEGSDRVYYYEVSGDNTDLKDLRDATGVDLKPVYKGITTENRSSSISLPNCMYNMNSNRYYTYSLSGLTEVSADTFSQMGYSLIGSLPTEDDQIVITQYIYEAYNTFGFRASVEGEADIEAGSLTADDTATGILGKHIAFNLTSMSREDYLNSINFEIVGIVDTKLPQKYATLKNDTSSDLSGMLLQSEFITVRNYGMHNLMFVNDGLIQKAITKNMENSPGITFNARISYQVVGGNTDSVVTNYVRDYTTFNQDDILYFDSDKTTITGNEIIVNEFIFTCFLNSLSSYGYRTPTRDFYYDTGYSFDTRTFYDSNDSSTFFNYMYNDLLIRYVLENGVPEDFKRNYIDILYPGNTVDYFDEFSWQQNYVSCLKSEYVNLTDVRKLGAKIVYSGVAKFLTEEGVYDFNNNFTLSENTFGNSDIEDKCSIVGVAIASSEINIDLVLFVTEEFATKYGESDFGLYSSFIGAMPTSQADIMKLIRYSYDGTGTNGNKYTLQNQVTSSLDNINFMIEVFVPIFLYVGLGLAAFAALLLANFIAVSISNKKREIGILRAVGAKSSDVFAIFFNESFIIAMINFVLALVGTIVGANVLNGVFIEQLGISITILVFGIRQIALLLAVSVGVAFLASFLPVMAIARKQPIDSIRER